MKNPEEEWPIGSYDIGNGQKYSIVANPEDSDYKIRYSLDRYGVDRVHSEGYENLEDAEQVLIGKFEQAGFEDMADEVLEE